MNQISWADTDSTSSPKAADILTSSASSSFRRPQGQAALQLIARRNNKRRKHRIKSHCRHCYFHAYSHYAWQNVLLSLQYIAYHQHLVHSEYLNALYSEHTPTKQRTPNYHESTHLTQRTPPHTTNSERNTIPDTMNFLLRHNDYPVS